MGEEEGREKRGTWREGENRRVEGVKRGWREGDKGGKGEREIGGKRVKGAGGKVGRRREGRKRWEEVKEGKEIREE